MTASEKETIVKKSFCIFVVIFTLCGFQRGLAQSVDDSDVRPPVTTTDIDIVKRTHNGGLHSDG